MCRPFSSTNTYQGMVLRSALLASLTDSEKSVKNLVNDTNLRLAGLLLPHQRIGEEEAPREAATPEDVFEEANIPEQARYGEPIFEEPAYFDQMVDGPCDVPIIASVPIRGVNIREPSDIPARRTADEVGARAKNKGPAPEQCEVSSSDDEGIDYKTCLDNLSILEDLFSGIYPFNLASSVESIAKGCSYNFDWDNLDAGSLSVCLHVLPLFLYLIHICFLGY